jgi:hypothetical protein
MQRNAGRWKEPAAAETLLSEVEEDTSNTIFFSNSRIARAAAWVCHHRDIISGHNTIRHLLASRPLLRDAIVMEGSVVVLDPEQSHLPIPVAVAP